MEWNDLNNKDIIANNAYLWLEAKVAQYHAKSIYLPAGGTPEGLYKEIETNQPEWFKSKKLIQVDEILTGNKTNIFRDFFAEQIPSYFFQLETPQANHFQQADLAILGIGINGHIAFHEPEQSQDFKFGPVTPSAITRKSLNLEESVQAISYGARAFLGAKAILLIISGESKREIVQKLDKGFKCPASLLFNHPDITILCEKSLRQPAKASA
jgi:6-phosphogluconolactonase/glucosamine-6-phosphate isomerase/deaminase